MKLLFFFTAWMMLLSSCGSEKERSLVWYDEFEGNGMPDTVQWNPDAGDVAQRIADGEVMNFNFTRAKLQMCGSCHLATAHRD